jgi:hypothetical protein
VYLLMGEAAEALPTSWEDFQAEFGAVAPEGPGSEAADLPDSPGFEPELFDVDDFDMLDDPDADVLDGSVAPRRDP